jgi:hypothetical protein
MDLEVPYLDDEGRHLLATGHLRATEPESDDSTTLQDAFSENSKPPEAVRPTIAHLKSADIIDQYILAKENTFKAEKISHLPTPAPHVCVNAARD